MVSGNVTVSSSSRENEIKKLLEKIKTMDVLVGIPQAEDARQGDAITNAELMFCQTNGIRKKAMRMDMEGNIKKHGYSKAYKMYIQANGSPLWHSPPRPVIEPAIEADKEAISGLLKDALKAGLDGNLELAKTFLDKAGLEGQAASQDWFDNAANGWAPNSPLTIEKKKSDKPLIDTGELRKAITYVVRDGDR